MNDKQLNNLLEQAEKVRRHNRQNSYKSRQRYYEAYKRFLRFAAEHYGVQKLRNISGKHLTDYVKHMQERGLSPSTIKTDLAGIRKFHDQVPGARYALPQNCEMELDTRVYGKADRRWSDLEVQKMICACEDAGRDDYAACIVIARHTGLRLEEVFKLDTAAARAALRHDRLSIKGKNGRPREVPINDPVRVVLEQMLNRTAAGHKLFVPDGKGTHTAKKELENFIASQRSQIQAPDAVCNLTFHGLRHSYAAEQYLDLLAEGKTKRQAKLQVSKLLGHNREDVTRLYLAGVLNREDGDADV
ncbi:MAG: site-specific integrase [Clostridiales bacterium]|nr:site-specific integrase [Clostridiales bacterium]